MVPILHGAKMANVNKKKEGRKIVRMLREENNFNLLSLFAAVPNYYLLQSTFTSCVHLVTPKQTLGSGVEERKSA